MNLCRRLFSLMLVSLLLSGNLTVLAESSYDPEKPENLTEDDIAAEACILIEMESGDVIFEKNADDVHYPASTTKVMTVLLGILYTEDLSTMTTISYAGSKAGVRAMYGEDSSVLGTIEGEEISMKDLLYGTILRSGNDGAIAIAEQIAGSETAFVDLMNQAAQQFGMSKTHFMNAHGLHNEYHYTSARDLATLAYIAMQNETFADIAGRVTYNMAKTNMQKERTISTGHRIMLKNWNGSENAYYYVHANGIKSGYTDAAGNCYIGAAEKDGVKLISVVLKSGHYDVWRDTKKLMEYGFSQYTSKTLTELYQDRPLKVYTIGYEASDRGLGELELSCSPVDPKKTVTISGTHDTLQYMSENLRELLLVQYTRELRAPISAGEIIGTMTYITEDGEAVEYNLLATRSIPARSDPPLTLDQIVAMTEADPNPLPPLTAEVVLNVLSPVLVVLGVILVLRIIFSRRRKHYARVPKNKNRYVK